MPYDLSNELVVGISSLAQFDIEEENVLFDRDGINAHGPFAKSESGV
jgi:hypothetical protein